MFFFETQCKPIIHNTSQPTYVTLLFFTKFGMEEKVHGHHPHAKFRNRVFKNVGLKHPKSLKLVVTAMEVFILSTNDIKLDYLLKYY